MEISYRLVLSLYAGNPKNKKNKGQLLYQSCDSLVLSPGLNDLFHGLGRLQIIAGIGTVGNE